MAGQPLPFPSLGANTRRAWIKSMPFIAMTFPGQRTASETQLPPLIGRIISQPSRRHGICACRPLRKRQRQLTRASFCNERSSWSGFLPNNTGQ